MDSIESEPHQLSARRGRKRRRRPLEALQAGLRRGVAYLAPRVGRGQDSRFPSTEDRFTAASAPGLGTQTDFMKAELSAAFDWRDQPSHARVRRPLRGQRRAARRSRPRPVRLSSSRRQSAAVRAAGEPLSRARPASRGRVHQRRQRPGRSLLPATHARRCNTPEGISRVSLSATRTACSLGAEYRWEAWWALDGALFVDAGTVAPSRRDLSLGDMEVGYGIGFRFHSNSAVVTRLDLAFSREGFVPLLRFEHVF